MSAHRSKIDRRCLIPTAAAHFFLLFPLAANSPALNSCDLNGDGSINLIDVQLAVNMAIGELPCTANIIGSGVCNIIVVQRITDAALTGACVLGTARSVSLNWTASTSSNVTGYHIYRGTTSTGPYTKVTTSPVAGTTYTDSTVQAGVTYYYVATAVDAAGNESTHSNRATAVVPYP